MLVLTPLNEPQGYSLTILVCNHTSGLFDGFHSILNHGIGGMLGIRDNDGLLRSDG